MIVAAGTGEREAEHGLRNGIDLLIDEVELELALVALVVALAADGEEAGGDDLFRLLVLRFPFQEVASDLFFEELVVRLVLLETVDDVVAVAPGMRVEHVRVLAAALGVAGDVEPVTRPFFAVALAVEIHVDHALHRVWRGVGDEGFYFIRRRWKAGEVESDAPDERGAVCIACGLQIGFFELGEDEAVDVGFGPVFGLDGRRGCFDRFLEGPVFAAFVDVDRLFAVSGRGGRSGLARVRSAHFDPFAEVRDDVVRQFLLRRHLHVLIRPKHGLVDGALGQIARCDAGMAAFAAEAGTFARVEHEAALHFLRFGAVALVAGLHEHRTDVFLKERELIRRNASVGSRGVRSTERGGEKDGEQGGGGLHAGL